MNSMTIKEIRQMDDIAFAVRVLNERLDKLNNPNAPLATKLRCSMRTLENIIDRETRCKKSNWWSITYSGDAGQVRYTREMPESELIRIGKLVARGYFCGEIYGDEDDSQHASDVANCLNVIQGLDDDAVIKEYGVSIHTFEALADKMGYAMRRNLDKYHMDEDDALNNAIENVLDAQER